MNTDSAAFWISKTKAWGPLLAFFICLIGLSSFFHFSASFKPRVSGSFDPAWFAPPEQFSTIKDDGNNYRISWKAGAKGHFYILNKDGSFSRASCANGVSLEGTKRTISVFARVSGSNVSDPTMVILAYDREGYRLQDTGAWLRPNKLGMLDHSQSFGDSVCYLRIGFRVSIQHDSVSGRFDIRDFSIDVR